MGNWTKRKGQVGLMLLVVMAVVLGIVLSVATSALTDTVLTRQEQENNYAFSIAEGGVEEALRELAEGNVPVGANEIGDSLSLVSGSWEVASLSSFEMYVKEGEGVEVDVSSLGAVNLTINWTKTSLPSENVVCSGEGSGNAPAAVGLSVQTATGVRRAYYNGYNCSPGGNGFAASASGTGGFRSQTTLGIVAGDRVLRITPYYNGATVKVTGSGLTQAMFRIEAYAQGGDAQKEIEVKRSREAAGSVFDYALFSGQTIVKN